MRHDYDPQRPNGAAVAVTIIGIGVLWGAGILGLMAVVYGGVGTLIAWVVSW